MPAKAYLFCFNVTSFYSMARHRCVTHLYGIALFGCIKLLFIIQEIIQKPFKTRIMRFADIGHNSPLPRHGNFESEIIIRKE